MLRRHISQQRFTAGFSNLMAEVQANNVWSVSGDNVCSYEDVCEFAGIEKYFHKRSD